MPARNADYSVGAVVNLPAGLRAECTGCSEERSVVSGETGVVSLSKYHGRQQVLVAHGSSTCSGNFRFLLPPR